MLEVSAVAGSLSPVVATCRWLRARGLSWSDIELVVAPDDVCRIEEQFRRTHEPLPVALRSADEPKSDRALVEVRVAASSGVAAATRR